MAVFSCDRLGLERGYRFPEEGAAGFLVVTLGDLSIGLTRTRSSDEAGRVDLWLYADDVDREVERLRRSDGTVVDEPADREWAERMATAAAADGAPPREACSRGRRAPRAGHLAARRGQ